MNAIIVNVVCILLSIVRFTAGQQLDTQDFLKAYTYECDGKVSANYTLHSVFKLTSNCEVTTVAVVNSLITSYLIQGDSKQGHMVNELISLAYTTNSAGAYSEVETLYLCTSGPLEGKFLYEKGSFLELKYLKKCSSVLGYSYTTSKSSELLISDRLDMNVLISPTGGFNVFKKGCTTVCRGHGYRV